MINETVFIPRIILCGDEAEFVARVGQRAFKIVGRIKFFDKAKDKKLNFLNDKKFLLGDKLLEDKELLRIVRGVDFVVFNESNELKILQKDLYQLGCPRAQMITTLEFKGLPTDGFYDMYSDIQLLTALKNLRIKTLLDVDAHFVKSRLFTKEPNDLTEIDCICDEEFYPFKENFYRRVYGDFSVCALKHYDAALILERSPDDFRNIFFSLEGVADLVIIFVRSSSSLVKYFQDAASDFEKIDILPSFTGAWIFFYRRKPPEDFAMYVVTHKKMPTEHVERLPEGYKVIHAGRVLGEELGYPGDDTGKNISELNPYINELTALYWIWKNTSHTVIGLSHYRRFFTTNMKTFLTQEEAIAILKNYDIIIPPLGLHRAPTREILRDDVCHDEEITALAEGVIRKNLARAQPDYLEAFDYKIEQPIFYPKNMFVARRPVFDSYCGWLFPLIINSTREVLSKTRLAELEGNSKRLMGFFAERLQTLWLIKNRLRIKEIQVVELKGL